MLRTTVAVDKPGLASIVPTWNEVFERAPLATPFQTPEWLTTWWSVHGGDQQLAVVVAWLRGEPSAVAPFALRQSPDGHTEAFMLGVGPTDYLDWLIAPGVDPAEIRRAIARELLTLGAETFVLTDVPSASPLRRLPHTSSEPCESCPSVLLPRTKTELMASWSRNTRSSVRRSLARFSAAGGAELHVAHSPRDVAERIDGFIRLHFAWWETRQERSVLHDRNATAFLHQVLPALAARRMVELSWLEIDGQVASVFVTLVDVRRRYYYVSANAPAFAAWSPGVAHMYLLIERAIAHDAAELDLLRGREPYKDKWTSFSRQTWSLRGRVEDWC